MKSKINLKSNRVASICSSTVPFAFTFDLPDKFNEATWPPVVNSVGLVITNKCNSQCPYCYNNSSRNGNSTLSVGNIINFLEFASRDAPIESVGLSGGEPFLHPNILSIISEVKSKGIAVYCTTGANGLTNSMLDSAIDAGLNGIVFSVDDFHSYGADFNFILSFIERAAQKLENVKVSMACDSEDEAYEKMHTIDNLLSKNVIFQAHPIFRKNSNGIFSASRSWKLEDCSNCISEFSSIALNHNGDVYACCSISGFNAKLKILNIYEKFDHNCLGDFYINRDDLHKLYTDGPTKLDAKEGDLQHKCYYCQQL